MNVRGTLIRLLGIVAVFSAAACASTRPPPTQPSDFPRQTVVETFSVGFDNIAEKYIEPVSIEGMAMEGMRGLGAIDPALTVTRSRAEIVLTASQREVAEISHPKQ